MKKILLLIIWISLFLFFSCQKQMKIETENTIKVAVFNGYGASPKCVTDAVEALQIDSAIITNVISADEILNGGLGRVDVLLFAGGSGSRQMSNMGDLVIEKVQKFVLEDGKGIVGICAGAYLLSTTPDYTCMHLCPAEAIDREHDERGHGLVKFSLTEAGKKIFPELATGEIYYSQYYEGPVLIPASNTKEKYTELATMLSDVHLENDAPVNMTNNRPFLLNNTVGKGRVFLTIAHPENTPGMRWIVPRMVRWVSGKELISYSDVTVRPEVHLHEVLFDKELRKKEYAHFSDLIFGNSNGKINAINQLVEIKSWSAKERIAGLLRDADPEVRLAAAQAIVNLEHTAAFLDLQTIWDLEKNEKYKTELGKCMLALANMVNL